MTASKFFSNAAVSSVNLADYDWAALRVVLEYNLSLNGM